MKAVESESVSFLASHVNDDIVYLGYKDNMHVAVSVVHADPTSC